MTQQLKSVGETVRASSSTICLGKHTSVRDANYQPTASKVKETANEGQRFTYRPSLLFVLPTIGLKGALLPESSEYEDIFHVVLKPQDQKKQKQKTSSLLLNLEHSGGKTKVDTLTVDQVGRQPRTDIYRKYKKYYYIAAPVRK